MGNVDQHFHSDRQVEDDVDTVKHLQFRPQLHNACLGPRGCIRVSMTHQLVGAVPSIQYSASTAGLNIFSIMITIQEDCVSPSEEQLTGSQGSWSRQQNRLLTIGIDIRSTPTVESAGQWVFGRSSGHGIIWLLSSVWFVSVFQWLSVWRMS